MHLFDRSFFEGFEPSFVQSLADLLHQMIVIVEVVHDTHAQAQGLLGFVEVPEVGSGIAGSADRAAAAFLDRAVILGIPGALDVYGPVVGVKIAVPAVSAGIQGMKCATTVPKT